MSIESETDAGSSPASASGPPVEPAEHPHDFEVQKEIHRRIRNDPDYDDWEYGTEPLPHEAWVPARPPQEPPSPSPSGSSTR